MTANSIRFRKKILAAILFGLLFISTSNALAQNHAPVNSAELESFLDTLVTNHMQELHIPGMALTIVKDGEFIFAKGYGYANLESKAPVIPEKTLFQIASVSKLFTATAAMQLVENQRIDLHTDVNAYLDEFEIDDAFPQPVTLHHLLTHTAGFDERNIGYASRTAEAVPPLGEYLAARMPPRTLPPGRVTSYSNHGFALVGHLVEQSAGMPFADYIRENIFEPLDMQRSTFLLPLPSHLAGNLAVGYRYSQNEYQPMPTLYRNAPPAGAMSATATDIAKFMIAHLQGGLYQNRRILQETTTQAMHSQQFTHHSKLPGMGYAFSEHFENGFRALVHSGQTPGYSSLLFLLPEQNFGLFLVGNRMTSQLGKTLVSQFMDRYFPATEIPAPQAIANFRDRTQRYVGAYRITRYAYKSLESVPLLFLGQFHVYATSEGYIRANGSDWVEIEPLLFQRKDGEGYLAFEEDENGRISHLYRNIELNGGSFPGAYERLSWYEGPYFLNEYLSSLAAVPLLLLLGWAAFAGITYVVRRFKGRNQNSTMQSKLRTLAILLAIIFVVSELLFSFGFIAQVVRMASSGGGELLFGMPDNLQALLWLPFLIAVCTVGMICFAVQAWRQKYWHWLGRTIYALLAISTLLWMEILIRYHLLVPSY